MQIYFVWSVWQRVNYKIWQLLYRIILCFIYQWLSLILSHVSTLALIFFILKMRHICFPFHSYFGLYCVFLTLYIWQVAQFILDDFILRKKGSTCHVICTQPRRISAISVTLEKIYSSNCKLSVFHGAGHSCSRLKLSQRLCWFGLLKHDCGKGLII